MALSRTLMTPTYNPFPSLMVEGCLVLAPYVDLFLNSCKQGFRERPLCLVNIMKDGHMHTGSRHLTSV